jgi:hypothetical protein
VLPIAYAARLVHPCLGQHFGCARKSVIQPAFDLVCTKGPEAHRPPLPQHPPGYEFLPAALCNVLWANIIAYIYCCDVGTKILVHLGVRRECLAAQLRVAAWFATMAPCFFVWQYVCVLHRGYSFAPATSCLKSVSFCHGPPVTGLLPFVMGLLPCVTGNMSWASCLLSRANNRSVKFMSVVPLVSTSAYTCVCAKSLPLLGLRRLLHASLFGLSTTCALYPEYGFTPATSFPWHGLTTSFECVAQQVSTSACTFMCAGHLPHVGLR